jgi:hypothetical protein
LTRFLIDKNRDLQDLRRDVLRAVAVAGAAPLPARKASLYGSVPAGDVTEEIIAEAQGDVVRRVDDV